MASEKHLTYEAYLSGLEKRYGQMLGTKDLCEVLGLKSHASFRQALARGALGFPVFRMPNRAGHFALAADVAHFVWSVRESGLKKID